jgi:Uma2 family endonuclease
MSREDFFLWAEAQHGRYEYDGVEPVAMTGGTLNHSLICQNLWAALRRHLRGSAYTVLGPDAGLATGGNAVRYPDALVTAGPIDGNARLASDVVLVFEVLSPTSGRTDRIEKPRAYFGVPSIRRYVIAEYEFVGLTVLERDAAGAAWKATTLGTGDTLRLPDLGIEIPLTEFYQDIDLPLPEPSAGG